MENCLYVKKNIRKHDSKMRATCYHVPTRQAQDVAPSARRETNMKRVVAEDSFWDLFPDATIGVVAASGILPTDQVSEENAANAAKLLDHANATADKWLTSTTISQNEVVAVWREAYRKFKTKKGVRSSVENLLKRILKDNPVGHINPSVDVSNSISLKYALPIGAENVDAIQGDMRLAVTEGGDEFLPVGEEESDPTLPGELAYLDDKGAICRCWNWRDGQRTEVTDETPHCVFIMENLQPERQADLQAAIDDLAVQLHDLLGATIDAKGIISKDSPAVTIEE